MTAGHVTAGRYNGVMASIHETAVALQRAGVMDRRTLREFDRRDRIKAGRPPCNTYGSDGPSLCVGVPELDKKIRAAYDTKSGWVTKLLWNIAFALLHFAVRIAVPICFCLVVDGSQHLFTGSAALAA